MKKSTVSEIDYQEESRYLIVNADDFGLSPGINQAIIQAYEFGILTSATLLANMPSTEDAVRLSHENPGLGVGVHLNFLRGAPLSEPGEISSLVDEEGRFVQRAGILVKRILRGKIKPAELETELTAQVQKIVDLGIKPSHFDSEKNLHLLPVVTEVMIGVAKKFGVKAVRYTDELSLTRFVGAKNSFFNPQYYKMRFLAFLARRARPKLEVAKLKFPPYFWGVVKSGQMDGAAYKWILPRLPGGVTEIMCHPGFVDEELEELSQSVGGFYINPFREMEFHGLVAPGLKEIVRKRKINLINYRDLSS